MAVKTLLTSEGCPNIQTLKMSSNNITDASIIKIAKGCRDMQSLYLEGCVHITDKCLISIARGRPNVRTLSLETCTNIADKGVYMIAEGCPQIKNIALY
jgi:EIN3-binding F-box protein